MPNICATESWDFPGAPFAESGDKDGTGQDLAVIFFSGQGAIIDDRFNLLPYGVDARTPADLKLSAISADEFHDKVAEIAKYGRMLVLLDACHSGAVTGTGSALTSNADVLRMRVSASNLTVHRQRILPRRRKVEQCRVHQSATRRIIGIEGLTLKSEPPDPVELREIAKSHKISTTGLRCTLTRR